MNNFVLVTYLGLPLLVTGGLGTAIFATEMARSLDEAIEDEEKSIKMFGQTTERLETMHSVLAYNEKEPNPPRVIALRRILLSLPREHGKITAFEEAAAYASDYYGQVKYLLQMKQFIRAGIFLHRHFLFVDKAILAAKEGWRYIDPVTISVLGAGLYGIALKTERIPLVGRYFAKKAASPLEEAWRMIRHGEPVSPLGKALIASALWRVGGEQSEHYEGMKYSGITRSDKPEDVARVARNMRMTLDQLHELVSSTH